METLGQVSFIQSVQQYGLDIGLEVQVWGSVFGEFLDVREFEINRQTGIQV